MADSVIFNNDTSQIWSLLISKGMSKEGAAGMLGNMYAESACYPARLQGDNTSGYIKSNSYTSAVNSKSMSEYTFVHDSKGYGLCQWTYYSRKQDLYDRTVKLGKSVANIEAQIDFAILELKATRYTVTDPGVSGTYVWDVLKAGTGNSVAVCSNAILLNFEKPASGDKNKGKRASYSQEYYNKYKSQNSTNISTTEVNTLNNLLNIANAQIGITESPAGSNKVKYNTWYYGREVSGSSYPWCMVFVQWCCNEAGISMYKTASCGTFLKNTSESSFVSRDALQPGDIVFFTHSESISSALAGKRADHVGIVFSNNEDGTITTIEGNTGSQSQDNGGAVRKKTRYLDKASLNQGGGIVCGVRLVEVTYAGITIPTESAASKCSWIEQTLSNLKNKLSNLFSSNITSWEQYQTGSSISSRQYEYKEFTTRITKDQIISADLDPNINRTRGTNLLTTPTLVESPFILLEVGNYTFGSYSKSGNFNKLNSTVTIDYPNYMTSIDVVKINGIVNQYTIEMVYQIQAGQDPNLVDKIFSSVGYGTVYISYGDWNSPTFTYKREEAIITNLSSRVDFSNSRITYTLKCTSNSLALIGGYYNFSAVEAKPSDILYNMLYLQNSTYRLLEAFPGMTNETLIRAKGLIRTDDSVVKIEAKQGMDALSYINYLVSCMSSADSSRDDPLRDANYYLTICDDTTGEYGGAYFKITKVSKDSSSISLDMSNVYEVDVGYPGDNLVTRFEINNDTSWALLYNYSRSVIPDLYTYAVDNKGHIIQNTSPSIITSSRYGRATETQRSWWTQMTQFPISATLEIKGLVRPALLMTYVRINALFYGQRHTSSGLYVITEQRDRVTSNGYRTTLSLTRIAGDLDVIKSTTMDVTVKLPQASNKNNSVTNTWNKVDSSTNTITKVALDKAKESQEIIDKAVQDKQDRVQDSTSPLGQGGGGYSSGGGGGRR